MRRARSMINNSNSHFGVRTPRVWAPDLQMGGLWGCRPGAHTRREMTEPQWELLRSAKSNLAKRTGR